jgi:predicted NUDIX family NTP pyrophosphohydrolase
MDPESGKKNNFLKIDKAEWLTVVKGKLKTCRWQKGINGASDKKLNHNDSETSFFMNGLQHLIPS